MRAWQPATVPKESRFALLSMGRTRYELAGPADGKQVLLVHGLTYPLEVWTPLFRHLAALGLRVCRYDLPGRGLSAHDGTPLTAVALARHLFELSDTVGFTGPARWVALSNSDLLLAQAALLAPERVAGMVWVAPSGLDQRTMNGWTRTLRRLGVLHPWAERVLRDRSAQRIRGHVATLGPEASAEVRLAYDLALRSVQEGSAFARAALSQLVHAVEPNSVSVLASQLADLLETRRIPLTALCFRGERDTNGAGVEILLKPLRVCVRHELEGTHMGLLETPEPVNACVARALEGV